MLIINEALPSSAELADDIFQNQKTDFTTDWQLRSWKEFESPYRICLRGTLISMTEAISGRLPVLVLAAFRLWCGNCWSLFKQLKCYTVLKQEQ